MKRFGIITISTSLLTIISLLSTGCQKFPLRAEALKEVDVLLPGLSIDQVDYVQPYSKSASGANSVGATETTPSNAYFSVKLVTPEIDSSTTKANVALSNVWVLQFDGSGTNRKCVYIGEVPANNKINATLLTGDHYTIYFVANGPGDGSFSTNNPTTLTSFENDILYKGSHTTDNEIPLCGKIENVTVLDNGQLWVGRDITVVPSVKLRRTQAKIQLNLTYNVSGATLEGVWMYNVPIGSCYGLGDIETYPNAIADNFVYTDGFLAGATAANTKTSGTTTTYTWYIGDNRRGENPAITRQNQKGGEANTPKYATYIRIKGYEDAYGTGQDKQYLYHDIYLGENATSDFNVLRNWEYIFQVQIGGTLTQQKTLPLFDYRVTAGTSPRITSSSIDPLPDAIDRDGSTFTVKLEGFWGTTPIAVRAQLTSDGGKEYVENSITYNEDTKGGSATLVIPQNPTQLKRSVAFQYQWENNWITIVSLDQKGQLIDVGANIVLGEEPNLTGTWQEAIDYCKNKNVNGESGWRLPTSNELLFYWCIMPTLTSDAERFSPDRHYWSARKYSDEETPECIFALYSTNGHMHKNYAVTSNEPGIGGTVSTIIKPTDKNYIRCVKTIDRSNAYPKFEIAEDGGVIVILRDDDGGLDEATLFPHPLTQTLSGDEQSEDNRMSRRFRVQKTTDTQVTASYRVDNLKNYCDTLTLDGYDNWRVPSQREMMLLFAIGASNYVQNGDADNTGVSAGQALVPTYLHQQEGMTPFETTGLYGGYISATDVNIRNNESRWTVYMGEYASGASGYTSNKITGFYTRCIRDEW